MVKMQDSHMANHDLDTGSGSLKNYTKGCACVPNIQGGERSRRDCLVAISSGGR